MATWLIARKNKKALIKRFFPFHQRLILRLYFLLI